MKHPERSHPQAKLRQPGRRGFALVVSLSLMVLLTILALGSLSLSATSLRSSHSQDAQAQAYANARIAVTLALGQLQKYAGDDRRVTADAAISPQAAQPQLAGVYASWSPNFVSQPDKAFSGTQYTSAKTTGFKGWLASCPEPAAALAKNWAETAPDSSWVKLFSARQNGFDLSAQPVYTESGSLAWVVTQ